jgi:hypothetical protein
MKHEFIERFVSTLVVEQDETDDDALSGKRFDLAIKAFEIARVWFEVGGIGSVEQMGEVDIESGVLDSQRESVINHLDLETFFGCGQGKVIRGKWRRKNRRRD